MTDQLSALLAATVLLGLGCTTCPQPDAFRSDGEPGSDGITNGIVRTSASPVDMASEDSSSLLNGLPFMYISDTDDDGRPEEYLISLVAPDGSSLGTLRDTNADGLFETRRDHVKRKKLMWSEKGWIDDKTPNLPPAPEVRLWASRTALLQTGTVVSTVSSTSGTELTEVPYRERYFLAFESAPQRFDSHRVVVRVWDREPKSRPGNQPQIVQITSTEGIVLSAQVVGGQPWMWRAWIGRHSGRFESRNRLFIYIKCTHRHRSAPGVYLYEVSKDLSIESRGVFYNEADLNAEELARQWRQRKAELKQQEDNR